MEKPQIVLTEDRNFSGVINATFGFIGQEFKKLFKTMLLYGTLPMILAGFATALYTKGAFENLGKPASNVLDAMANSGVFSLWYIVTMLMTFIAYFMMSGLTFAYLRLYREKGSGNFEISDVWNLFLSKVGRMFAHQFVAGLAILFFSLLLVIPGIYVAIPLSFVMMVAMEEDVTFSENWSRCFYLARNNWWVTLGLFIVIGIIVAVLSSIVSLPATIYTLIITFKNGVGGQVEFNTTIMTVTFIVATFAKLLLYVVLFVAQGVQYYNLVEKKDKISLIGKINNISAPTI